MSDIDEIKSRLNIVDIIGERVTLKKAGRNLKGLCPFHSEKTPSFIVSPDRQTFHCFGCGKGGSAFDFIMLLDHIDFSEALETLAERAGVRLERRPTDTPEAKLKQRILEANHLASEYYHYLLTKHAVGENARDYLKHRGVSDKSMKTFSLGYSPNNWDGLLTYLHKKGYEDAVLEAAGLVIRGTRGCYDRFRGRVMFTLKDHRGNAIGFSGRVLDPTVKEAKYINTSETPVYVKGKVLYALDVTKDAIQKANEAIVMEGELDVISSFQAGIANVVAIKGSAVTEDHARLLRRFAERLVFALDSDLAGDAAARRGIEIAEKNGFDMRVATMPSGKDPDEAARENPGLLKKALKDASPVYDYFLSSALTRFDGTSSFGKRKISDEFLPVLHKIDNPIVQGHYIRKLAEALGISDETVRESLAKHRVSRVIPVREVAPGAQKPVLSRLEKAEVYVLALLLQGKSSELWSSFHNMLPTPTFQYLPVRRILESMESYIRKQKAFTVKEFADSLPAELVPAFDEAFLWDISTLLDDDVRFAREWEKALHEVKRAHVRQRMEEIGGKLRDISISSEEHDALQTALKGYTDEFAALEKGS
ncbi:DNA primase [Candidatus Gottesmanbacteria bacterium]|nr:DNA primase [Candidatus Gottesmanbacteria bacterium]